MVSLQILEKQPRLWSSLAGPLIDRMDSNLKPGEIFDNSMSLKGLLVPIYDNMTNDDLVIVLFFG